MDKQTSDIARLLAVDALLIKAAGLGTEAVFLNMEHRLNRILRNAWQNNVDDAISAVRSAVRRGAGAKAIAGEIADAFQDWQKQVKPAITAVTRDAYLEGKRQILLRAHGLLKPIGKSDGSYIMLVKAPTDPSLEANLTLVDQSAVDQLIEQQLYWIGEYYDNELSDSISDLVRETMIETGLGREEAGKLLEQHLLEHLAVAGVSIPEGWGKGPAAYFELLAANTASNARVRGSLGQMIDIGVTKYTITAVGDERTCGRCRLKDGTTYEVQHAQVILDQIASAETPEQVKQLHPWANKTSEIEANPDKFPFPPFHGSCRCVVDIADDAEITFEPMKPG